MSKSPAQKPIPADQCPHLGREYNHFAGPHLENPYPFFERLRKEAPVTFNPMLGMWLVSRYDDITAVLNNASSYTSASSINTSVEKLTPEAQAILGPRLILHDSPLNMDPPAHTRVKRLLQKGFTPAKVARPGARIRQLANALIDGFIREGRVDLVERFSYPLPVQVILSMVGVPRGTWRRCGAGPARCSASCRGRFLPRCSPPWRATWWSTASTASRLMSSAAASPRRTSRATWCRPSPTVRR